MIASIIICTHNPRINYLSRVLDALREQTLPPSQWELLLIDNASQEAIASCFDISWHPHAKHITETTVGLTAARLRGIAEAQSDLLIFVDDDNLLSPNYLGEAARISHEFPFLGAWGAGSLRPEYESPPASWAQPYLSMLAVGDIEKDRWSNLTDSLSTVPCGAGLCVRKSVATEYQKCCTHDANRAKLDRTGTLLLSGGDTDLAMISCDLGLGTGMFRTLSLTHLIAASRLTLKHLTNLAESMAYSGELLWSIRGKPLPPTTQGPVEKAIAAYHRLRLKKEDRAIHDARQRGRVRAHEQIRRSNPSDCTKPT